MVFKKKGKLARRKLKKTKKHRLLWISIVGGVVIIAILAFLFSFSKNYTFIPKNTIFISSENPDQGSTVLIKASGIYPKPEGYFNNKKIAFFRNSKYSDWQALLGIDADMNPGEYKIIVFLSGKEIEKKINVIKKNFPSAKMVITKNLRDKGYTENKVLNNISSADNPVLEEVYKSFTPEPYFNSAFSFPLQNITKIGFDFGENISFTKYQVKHFGIDLKAAIDTSVLAVNDGRVVLAKNLSNYGKTIVIDHGLGIFSLYLHLNEFKVQEGDYVKNSQLIALSGNTGYSVGPHLHFSVRVNGARVDPILFIKETEMIKQSSGLASLLEVFFRLLNNIQR